MPIVRVPHVEPKQLTAADVERMVAEIDALLDECERTITDTKDKEVRAWFLGMRQGLRLAQAFARRVWPKDGR